MNLLIGASQDVLWREVDEEIVILDPKKGRYYGIEGIGVRIWELLQKQISHANLLKRLAQEYDVEEKRLREEVCKFIGKLEKSGLLKSACES